MFKLRKDKHAPPSKCSFTHLIRATKTYPRYKHEQGFLFQFVTDLAILFAYYSHQQTSLLDKPAISIGL